MPAGAAVNDDLDEARAFADSVAGVLRRHPAPPAAWAPGRAGSAATASSLPRALDDIGWDSLGRDPKLVACAGLGGLELGRSLAPVGEVDRLLGASPMAGDLIRCRDDHVATLQDGVPVLRAVLACTPCPSAEGFDVQRVTRLGAPAPLSADPSVSGRALAGGRVAAWRAASVGYLAGLGEAALELTVAYVRQRRAFGTTLGALAPVQQRLADAATAVRGVRLLAGDRPGADALAHAGPAIAEACAACHQATGAIGFTLEYPLHRFTQRARALAAWNDRLLDGGIAAAFA
jgi:butyryl-CoA dehydrogenase